MTMNTYTVAVGYGSIPLDGFGDAVEISVRAGSAAEAICAAARDYQRRYAAEYPADEVTYAEVIAVRKGAASPRRVAPGTRRRQPAPKATTAATTSGGRGRGGKGRRRA